MKHKEDIIIELSEKATQFAMRNTSFEQVDFDYIPFKNFTFYFPMAVVEGGESLNVISDLVEKTGVRLDPIEFNLMKANLLARKNYVNVRRTNDALYISSQDEDRQPLLEFELTDTNPMPVITYCYTAKNINPAITKEIFGDDKMMSLALIYLKMAFNVLCYLVKPKEEVTAKTRPIVDGIKYEHKRVQQKSVGRQKRYLTKKVYLVDDFEPYVPKKKDEKRSYTRQTDSWNVCGHWRHYKSGKKVWIPQSVRGKKDSDVKAKEVKIANMGGEVK